MATKSKNPYGEFYSLLAKLPYQTKESIVYEYSGQTHLSVLYQKNYPLFQKMICDMRRLTANPDMKKMNKLRLQVIAAIGQWFTASGQYADLSKEERLLKIKGTALNAAGSKGTSFNNLTASQLCRVMAEFNSKTETKKRVASMKELKTINLN